MQAQLEPIRSAVKALNRAHNAVALYPPESDVPREAAAVFVAALERVLAVRPFLQMVVGKDRLTVDGEDVTGDSGSVKRFATHLHQRQVGRLHFLPGLQADECVMFLRILAREPHALKDAGGLVSVLPAEGVEHVQVIDLAQEAAAYGALGQGTGTGGAEAGDLADLSLNALLAPEAGQVRTWLRGAAQTVASKGLSAERAGQALSDVVAGEAEKATALGGADGELGLSNLADAIASLDDESRGRILSNLVTSDRTAGLDAVVARVDDDLLASAVAAEASSGHTSPLALLSHSTLPPSRRDQIVDIANKLLLDAVDNLKLGQVPGATSMPQEEPVPLPSLPRDKDDVGEARAALATQARKFTKEERDRLIRAPAEAKGVDVGSAMDTLLHLLRESEDPAQAAETIAATVDMAQDALGQGRLDVLNSAVHGLRAPPEGLKSAPDLAQSVEKAIATLSSEEVSRTVVGLMRGPEGRSHVHDVTTYFTEADSSALEAVVDMLADDVAAEVRQAARDILATVGRKGLDALERHVMDERRAVAYSAVVIISNSGEPRVAPALQRALLHPDEQVGQAAVEGLASIGGSVAENALEWGIECSSSTVRLCAIRAAGQIRAECLVDVLGRVVCKRDMFGSAFEEKSAAVDSLAAIGTRAAIDVLRDARHQRFLFSPGRTRRLRASAKRWLDRPAAGDGQAGEGAVEEGPGRE